MTKVALSLMKDDLSKYLRQAEKEGIVITRHGRPAGILIGFESEDDWFDYRLENDPRFLRMAVPGWRRPLGLRFFDDCQERTPEGVRQPRETFEQNE